MSYDVIIGLLIGLAATCMGGLFAMLTMYWLGERDQGQGPPRDGFGDAPPEPPSPVLWEVPDFVPASWSEGGSDRRAA